MKKHLLTILCFLLSIHLFSNGVAVVNAEQGIYLRLVSSRVSVQVNSQIAITTATQVFRNQLTGNQHFKYAFPMPAGGSAVGLRWQRGGEWFEADFHAEAQDTTLPGGGGGSSNFPVLEQYLGAFPLFFEMEDDLEQDSLITIELTYVELLPYKNAKVTFKYPGKYTSIQQEALESQHFDLHLSSGRKIVQMSFLSHPGVIANVSDYEASVAYDLSNHAADADYTVEYELSSDDLGLFSFSVFLSDTLECDTFGNGFCAFVVEPNPNPNNDIIPKVFTLIIDNSGSMGGEKMIQARDAASFIVNNLNSGDLFNIVSFNSDVDEVASDHMPYNSENRSAALDYISHLEAGGSTNISGAFSKAVPEFSNDVGDTYNIIIFFTDGQPTQGITDATLLLNHINNLVSPLENELSIFTFGVGSDVNKPLLTNIANQNNGVAQFFDNSDLSAVISDFYQTIRNPVLVNTSMSFDPNLIYETYPAPLPNLYKGSQMLVVGRYHTPGLVNATFNGTAFGEPVTYNYPMVLSDKDSVIMRFLPKIWAKQKAEHLTQQYYAATDPAVIETLGAEIKHLSLCYGVITDLTSFEDNTGGGGGGAGGGGGGGGPVVSVYEYDIKSDTDGPVKINSLSPNPASDKVLVQFETTHKAKGAVMVEVFDLLGVKKAVVPVNTLEMGRFSAVWNIDAALPNGAYLIKVTDEEGNSDMMMVLVMR